MIEIALGALTFSILGCSVLLADMMSGRFHKPKTFPDREPSITASEVTVKTVETKPTRKKRHAGVQSPSKNMTLAQLEQIKADNYCGKRYEYFAEEVDELIMLKSQKRADQRVRDEIAKLKSDVCPF